MVKSQEKNGFYNGCILCFCNVYSWFSTVSELPQFDSTSVLVSTFIVQSFVSWRQSMGSSRLWEHVHNPGYTCIGKCGNFRCSLSLISTHTVSELPHFDGTFLLVSTFIVQSFLSWRQSMGSSRLWEHVHNPGYTCIGNVAISVAFWASYPHTLSLSYHTLTVPFF